MADDGAPTDKSNSKIDPLSSATRATKRNLLLASVVALTFKAFNISVEKISVAGLNMDFDRGVFEFLILLSLAYFFLTFCLYYYIDIRNFPKTEHEKRTLLWEQDQLDQFIHRYWEETYGIAKQLPPQGNATASISVAYVAYLKAIVAKPTWPSTLDVLKANGALPPDVNEKFNYITTGSNGKPPLPNSGSESQNRDSIRKLVVEVADRRAIEFPRQYFLFRLRLWPRLLFVRSAYLIRNWLTDGLLPIVFALYALGAFFNLWGVEWMRHLLPHDVR